MTIQTQPAHGYSPCTGPGDECTFAPGVTFVTVDGVLAQWTAAGTPASVLSSLEARSAHPASILVFNYRGYFINLNVEGVRNPLTIAKGAMALMLGHLEG